MAWFIRSDGCGVDQGAGPKHEIKCTVTGYPRSVCNCKFCKEYRRKEQDKKK